MNDIASLDVFPPATRPFFNGVSKDISDGDAMFAGNNRAHYFSVGASALGNILDVLALAKTRLERILDFGCGAGRVTRWLRQAFPQSAIEACDIRNEDLEFVSKSFGIKTWQSSIGVNELAPPSRYDLIWVGSVYTHLSEPTSLLLFEKMISWLKPNGILVFTTHGRYPASIGEQMGYYGIPEQWAKVVEDFHAVGFGYAGFHDTPEYGTTLTKISWWSDVISRRGGLKLLSMTEQAWDNHQDVIAVQRPA